MTTTPEPSQPREHGATHDQSGHRRVVILAGGLSHERDVSLRSGRRVAEAVAAAGVEASVRDVDAELMSWLRRERPD